MKVHVEAIVSIRGVETLDGPDMIEEMGLLCTGQPPLNDVRYAKEKDLSDVTCKRCLLKMWGKTLVAPDGNEED